MSSLTVFAHVKCPYCTHMNHIPLDQEKTRSPFVEFCDDEEGSGCGRYFVVQAEIKAVARAYPVNLEQD